MDDIKPKIKAKKKELVGYAQRIKDGEIGIYRDVANTLKQIHILNALDVRAIEKPTDLSNSELGLIGSILKKQYYQGTDENSGKKFGLKWLFRDVANQDLSIAMIEHRLNLYAQSGGITRNSVEIRNEVIEGKTEKRRILGKTDCHCDDCVRYADAGWVPITSNEIPIPMLKCQCRTNCLCTLSYR